MSNYKNAYLPLATLLGVFTLLPVLAEPTAPLSTSGQARPAQQSPVQKTQVQQTQLNNPNQVILPTIPAGAQGTVTVVMAAAQGPTTGFPVPENKQVALPVVGQIGNVELPQGTMLVGALQRINDSSGVLNFTQMLLNNKPYPVNLTSDPMPVQVRQDQEKMQEWSMKMQEKTIAMQEKAQSQAKGQGFNPLSMIPVVGMFVGSGGGDNAGEEMQKEMQDMYKNMPTITVAEIAPLQQITLHAKEAKVPQPIPIKAAPVVPQSSSPSVITPTAPISQPKTLPSP
ncbi:MAG: hypothetical protein WCA07_16435 [Gloeobacterales cyanobacterium]